MTLNENTEKEIPLSSDRLEIFIFLMQKLLKNKIENSEKSRIQEIKLKDNYIINLIEINQVIKSIQLSNLKFDNNKLEDTLRKLFAKIESIHQQMEQHYIAMCHLKDLNEDFFKDILIFWVAPS